MNFRQSVAEIAALKKEIALLKRVDISLVSHSNGTDSGFESSVSNKIIDNRTIALKSNEEIVKSKITFGAGSKIKLSNGSKIKLV